MLSVVWSEKQKRLKTLICREQIGKNAIQIQFHAILPFLISLNIQPVNTLIKKCMVIFSSIKIAMADCLQNFFQVH